MWLIIQLSLFFTGAIGDSPLLHVVIIQLSFFFAGSKGDSPQLHLKRLVAVRQAFYVIFSFYITAVTSYDLIEL